MTEFNNGKPYHGSSMVEGGKLTGATGRNDYFFFLCPRCRDSQVLQILEYEERFRGPMTRASEKGARCNEEFVLAFHLHCPQCGFDDFVKLGNGHQADKLNNKAA